MSSHRVRRELSFFAMVLERLRLPTGRDGAVWLHRAATPALADFHRHRELESSLVVAGTARYLVDDRRYDLCPGTQVWLFPGEEHLLVDRSRDFELWIAVYRPTLVRRVATEPWSAGLRRRRSGGPASRTLRPGDARRSAGLYRRCRDLLDRPDLLHATLAVLMLEAWGLHVEPRGLIGIGHGEASKEGAAVHPAVRGVAEAVYRESEPRNLASLAAEAGLSPPHLSRLFRQQLGVPFARYRQRVQLERFLRSLKEDPADDLLALALAAGFGSYAQFHRVVRQEYGCSPRELKAGVAELKEDA